MRAMASGSKRWPVAVVCWARSSGTSGSVRGASVVASATMLKGEAEPSQVTAMRSFSERM